MGRGSTDVEAPQKATFTVGNSISPGRTLRWPPTQYCPTLGGLPSGGEEC